MAKRLWLAEKESCWREGQQGTFKVVEVILASTRSAAYNRLGINKHLFKPEELEDLGQKIHGVTVEVPEKK